MSDNQKEPQYKLRWHEDLRDKVMQSAKEQNRSINAEIIARLEKSFEPDANPRETFEFESMERIYKEQAQELKLLREMMEKLVNTKP
ncbi:Arc family DNA-binding protein [Acinetobacter guillouiae]|uniref:Arc family DNA-binding protein n=1 Tax=Acinetobacter guillouiae TaxID=106649 RepID=UPI00125FBBDD|nr:Arc family DNA-binding protein [Acinetobacter guillouiae]